MIIFYSTGGGRSAASILFSSDRGAGSLINRGLLSGILGTGIGLVGSFGLFAVSVCVDLMGFFLSIAFRWCSLSSMVTYLANSVSRMDTPSAISSSSQPINTSKSSPVSILDFHFC